MPNPYDALQFSNPGNALMQAYDQGAARRDKADLQTALEAYSTNPQDSRALAKIMAMNPALGATLQDRSREASARDAFANLATGPMASPGIGDGMQGNAPAASFGAHGNVNALLGAAQPHPAQGGAMPPDPLAPLPDPQPMPSAQGFAGRQPQAPDLTAPLPDSRATAMRELARADPNTFIQLRRLDAEQQKQVADTLGKHLELGGRVIAAVMQAPPEQRQALYAELKTEMEAQGITELPEQWDEAAAAARMRLGLTTMQAMGVDLRERKLAADVADDNADNARADANAASLDRHRRDQIAGTRRGQDLRSGDQRRGQDATERGQDITSHDRRMSPAFRGKAKPTGRTATKRGTGGKPDEQLQELSDGRWVPIQ